MSREESAQALVSWLRSRGGSVNDKVDLFHPLPNGDRGVVAVQDIKEGEQLVLVPASCTLHVPTAQEHQELAPEHLPVAAKQLEGTDTSPFISTVLLLMAEMARGKESPWQHYITSLPPSCDCLLSWDDSDRALLKGTSIEDLTGGAATESAYNKEVAPRVTAAANLWPAPHNTFAEFCRVAGLVQSRAFHMVAENWMTGSVQEGAELFLIPAIDMINHASDAAKRNSSLLKFSTSMTVQVAGCDVTFREFFVMKAERDIKAGEQVLHTYGDLSDAQLLQTYGFIDFSEPDQATTAAAAKTAKTAKTGKGGAAVGEKRKKSKAAADDEDDDDEEEEGDEFRNPFNYVLIPFKTVLETVRHTFKVICAVPDDVVAAHEAMKLPFLEEAQLLQPGSMAQETNFVVTSSSLLSDELLTVVQVLLMPEDDFTEMVAEYRTHGAIGVCAAAPTAGGAASGSGAGGSSSKVKTEVNAEVKTEAGGSGSKAKVEPSGSGSAGVLVARQGGADIWKPVQAGAAAAAADAADAKPARTPLVLREELIAQDLDFAELVSLCIVKADFCMKRYPGSLKKDHVTLQELKKRLAAGSPAAGGGDAEQSNSAGGWGHQTAGEREQQLGGAAYEAEHGPRDDSGSEGSDGDEDESDDEDEEGEDNDDEGEEGDDGEDGLLNSDDSDKVGYGDYEFDDGPGQEHDRGKGHPAPKD